MAACLRSGGCPASKVFSVEAGHTGPTPRGIEIVEQAKEYKGLMWQQPFHDRGRTYVSVVAPVFVESAFLGAIVVSSDLLDFSDMFVAANSTNGSTGFILYGDAGVLAHPILPDLPADGLSSGNPLHSTHSLDDATVTQMLAIPPEFYGPEKSFKGFVVDTGDGEQLVLTSTATTFGTVPWVIGQYSPLENWSDQWIRMSHAALAGFGLLVASVLGALLLAKVIAAPDPQIDGRRHQDQRAQSGPDPRPSAFTCHGIEPSGCGLQQDA